VAAPPQIWKVSSGPHALTMPQRPYFLVIVSTIMRSSRPRDARHWHTVVDCWEALVIISTIMRSCRPRDARHWHTALAQRPRAEEETGELDWVQRTHSRSACRRWSARR
jgi:hypothetical protein